MPLSINSKKCLCNKQYTAITNDLGDTFTYKVGRTYHFMTYDYAPTVIGIYIRNNNTVVGINIEDFKNHFQETK